MLNTLFYAAILIVAGVIVNGLAGYALAKIKFPFRDRWLAIIMMLMIIPTETIITINFMFVSKSGSKQIVFEDVFEVFQSYEVCQLWIQCKIIGKAVNQSEYHRNEQEHRHQNQCGSKKRHPENGI